MNLTPDMILAVAYVLLLMSWIVLLYFINHHYRVSDKLMKSVEYWRESAMSLNTNLRRRANFHNPMAGDKSKYSCRKCAGVTEFEEYAARDGSIYSDLGLHCLKCDHREGPVDFYERFN